jgi:hypothetical protein
MCIQILVKFSNMKCHENSISISPVATWEQTERQGETNRCIFAVFHCKGFKPLMFQRQSPNNQIFSPEKTSFFDSMVLLSDAPHEDVGHTEVKAYAHSIALRDWSALRPDLFNPLKLSMAPRKLKSMDCLERSSRSK